MISFDRLRDPALLFALSCALALGWLLIALVPMESMDQVFAESGPIEGASVRVLIVAVAALGVDVVRRRAWGRWHLVALVAAAAFRELDWDKAFTDRGVLSLGLYSGNAPIIQKVGGAVVLVVLIWAGMRLLRRDLRPWLAGLRASSAWAWLMLTGLTLYGVAKTLDGLGRKLAPWGIEISDWANRTAGRGEEAMELFAAIIILQVVWISVLALNPRAPARAEKRAAPSRATLSHQS
ncbi:hypothetical protein [Paracoccus sp. Ld10]|uniref:hypothetical protein n=1 Tax=Paracoccus sp. Ld10 TaxID=649158 RepID=UPI00386B2A64